MNETSNNATLYQTLNNVEEKFKFDIQSLIRFIFPSNLQHPLSVGRLYTFGLYGPLDENGNIKTGIQGRRVLAEYELTEMCIQFEREDILNVYVEKPRDVGLLSIAEQEMIISQADGHLKCAKGKAMLPQIGKKEVEQIFESLPRDEYSRYSFHDAQKLIEQYRKDRILQYKHMYPALVKPRDHSKKGLASTQVDMVSMYTGDESTVTSTKLLKYKRVVRVSDAVAPSTMFQRMKGDSSTDISDKVTSYLSKHTFRVNGIDMKSDATSLLSNIKLLREVPPFCKDPFEGSRDNWDNTCCMRHTELGSRVNAPASSTSHNIRKATLY